jgi:tetratricopeptide (TPR) repeat protein
MRYVAILPAVVSLFSLQSLPRAYAAKQSASSKEQPTADLYQQATDLLKRGRDYTKAASMLSEAAKREPENLDFQLALGCTYASRYASIAFAMNRAESLEYSRREHARRIDLWERTHTLPPSPFFNTTPPEPPSPLATPDDGRAYTLTKVEALKQMTDLACKSLAAFKRAHKLAENAKTEQRMTTEYARGWAVLLLKKLGREIIYEKSATDKTGKVDEEEKNDGHPWIRHNEAIDCFKACISELEKAPDKSAEDASVDQKKTDSLQSLGLALVPSRLDNLQIISDEYINREPLSPEDLTAEAIEAFKKALVVKPGNLDLLYQMAFVYAPTKPSEAAACLERVVRRQGGNAVIWYLLSEQYVRQAESLHGVEAERLQGKAIAALESGNSALSYQPVSLNLPVPAWVAKAWGYDTVFGLGLDSRLTSYLYSYLSDIADQEIKKGDGNTCMRVALAMMRFGLNAIAHYKGDDLYRDAPLTQSRLYLRSLMGICNSMKAYSYMKTAAKTIPNDANLAVLENSAANIEFVLGWEKEIIRQIPNQP